MRHLLVLLGLLSGLVLPLPAAGETLRLDARSLFEKSVSRHLRLSEDQSAIVLEWGELFEDDGPAAGYSYKPAAEDLSNGVWIRKELIIANPKAGKAASKQRLS